MDPATVTLLVAVIGCVISVLAFVRSGRKDSTDDAKTQGQMLEKIDQVHQSVKELNKQYLEIAKFNSQSDERFKTLFSDVQNLKERMATVERKQHGITD